MPKMVAPHKRLGGLGFEHTETRNCFRPRSTYCWWKSLKHLWLLGWV